MTGRAGRPPGAAVLILFAYRLLLRLYPRAFRDRWRDDLMRHARDRASERRYRGPGGRLRLAGHLAADLLRTLPLQHALALRAAAARARTHAPLHSRGGPMETLLQDVRYAARTLLRQPAFAVLAITTAAAGIGATTVIFSVVDRVALRPLPYPDADRLIVAGIGPPDAERPFPVSPPDYLDWASSVERVDLAASRLERRTLIGEAGPQGVETAGVSTNFFDVLGVRPALGRGLGGTDLLGNEAPVAVLSHGFWQERFGGDPSVLGRTLTLDGTAFTVVGVLPKDFHPPEAIYQAGVRLWYPLRFVGDALDARGEAFLQVIGRMTEGVDPAAAHGELEARARAIAAATGGAPDQTAVVARPMAEATLGDVGTGIAVLLGAVTVLLLIACANVASLFLARGQERAGELAMRSALGAGRGRIVRQLLTESLLVGLLGGTIGVVLAFAGVALFRAGAPSTIPRLAEVAVDARILGFAALLSLLTGILFGLLPALRATRGRLAATLRAEGGQRLGRRARLQSGLVVTETALALVLLTGAGLLVNSFVRLHRVELGFQPKAAYYMRVFLPGERYPDDASRVAFFTSVRERIAALPGVESVGGTNNLPLTGNRSMAGFTIEGAEQEDPLDVSWHQVLPGYFDAAGIRVTRGRGLDPSDDAGSPPVGLVTESFVRRYLAGGEPLGARFKFGGPDSQSEWRTIVGVVEDVRQQTPAASPEPELYLAFSQVPRTGLFYVVRSGLPPDAILPALRSAVWEVDPALPIERAGPMEEQLRGVLLEPRFYTGLLAGFAAVALLLAAVGVYGIMTLMVDQRRRELGIRMALGAGRRSVLASAIGRGMGLALSGIGLGILGAVAATRVLGTFLFDVAATDPLTFAAVAALLAGVALVASWIPARSILRLDPARTLRAE